MIISISIKTPLFIVGPPGSSKTLAKTVVNNNMRGEKSKAKRMKQLSEIHFRVLQCSPLTTSNDLEAHLVSVLKTKDAVALLEEAGLAEMSPDMPLKILHEKFDAQEMACIATSNWQLDPSKMNRALFITRSLPDSEELVNTAIKIVGEGIPIELF